MTMDNKTKPVIALSGASGYIGTNLMNKLKKQAHIIASPAQLKQKKIATT